MNKNNKVIVAKENDSGRNEIFKDCRTGATMTRKEFVRQIKKGNYPNYYIRKINGLETPVSKPDGKIDNNLG